MTDQQDQDTLKNILDFLNAPEDETMIYMDCSDCDKLAGLAEQVASGAPPEHVLPALKEHLLYWKDCREEFYGLVAVLKAESSGRIQAALEEIQEALKRHDDAEKTHQPSPGTPTPKE